MNASVSRTPVNGTPVRLRPRHDLEEEIARRLAVEGSASRVRPIYTVIEPIIERSGTPYFSFNDIDENKPTGSIRIRIETIHYFLTRYVEDVS